MSLVDPVAVSLLALVVILHGCSRDFVDPRLLNLHLRPRLPESVSAKLLEVQQIVTAGWHAKMNVEVLAHEILTFRLIWSDLSVKLMVVVQLIVMRDSQL